MPERSSQFDSDFEQGAQRTRNVPKRVRTVEAASWVDLADAQETLANRPVSPQHRAVVSQSPNQIIAELPKTLPVKSPAPKAAVKVCVSPEPAAVLDAKDKSGATTAPTDADGFRRVSTRTNKRNAPLPLQPEFNFKRGDNYCTIIVVALAFSSCCSSCARWYCFA